LNDHPIHLHNTLTGRKEPFRTIVPGEIRMYVCGITPYDECHLGHARCYAFFDTVRRHFLRSGYKVTYIQNFTDIDDKIIARAQKLGETPQQVADRNIADYHVRMKALGVLPADVYPRVTEVVPEIVEFIGMLVARGMAYPVDGDVFYSVRKFPSYGKLSKRTIDEMESGARVEINEQKQDPLDFALWKKAKPGEPAWDSPWGPGRPGWHIECSVMSIRNLGETFDLHGGGHDLIFPHHENEIAQSEGATGKPFANYWLHNGFVTVNREKMSKSLGNFFTLREIFEKFDPVVVRFFLLSRHYRSPLDFSDDLLQQARSAWNGLADADFMAGFLLGADASKGAVMPAVASAFRAAMDNDFNTEEALAVLFQLKNEMFDKIKQRDLAWLKDARFTLREFCSGALGLSLPEALPLDAAEKLRAQLAERDAARKAKDWPAADRLRKELDQAGYLIEDTPSGSVPKPKR
jgi:cysteinyl-tRNA synthetase